MHTVTQTPRSSTVLDIKRTFFITSVVGFLYSIAALRGNAETKPCRLDPKDEHWDRLNWCMTRKHEYACNPLNINVTYRHHPVISSFQGWYGPVDPDYLVDFLGIRTYRAYDCNPAGEHSMNYHSVVPSRRIPCDWHSTLLAGACHHGYYPLVDDEYYEYVDLLETIKAYDPSMGLPFVMVEAGARYGTWAVRAGRAFQKMFPSTPYKLIAVEPVGGYANWARRHFMTNGFHNDTWEVHEQLFTPRLLHEILERHTVHFLDLDVQGGEWEIFSHAVMFKVMQRVHTVHIGLHSSASYSVNLLIESFRAAGFTTTYYFAEGTTKECDNESVVHATIVTSANCITLTDYGPIYVRDGLISLRNKNHWHVPQRDEKVL